MAEARPIQSNSTAGGGTISSPSGLALRAIGYGCTVTHLFVPDRHGQTADIVLGFASDSSYHDPHPYFGVMAGRVAGRISQAQFVLGGKQYLLAANDPPNHLHGGVRGFDKHVWATELLTPHSIRFHRTSQEGEEGYPGSVDTRVTYRLTPENTFIVDVEAETDRPTPFSLTHHSYFNLAGEVSNESVAEHELEIFASDYAPADETMGLTGRREPVTAANDFRRRRTLGEAIPKLHRGHGDLYFTTALRARVEPARAARLVHGASGRVMDVWTNEPCIQLYTGVGLDGSLVGKSGRAYGQHAGMCLECEGYPDGANHPELGDIILQPGQRYFRRTIYAFSTTS